MIILLTMFIISIIISNILMLINIMISKKMKNIRNKLSPFECGFETLESTRLPFSIHFYMIAMLFLVFDVEIVFLFSMIISSNLIYFKSWMFCSMMIMIILFLGLEFEKKEGCLKWMT